jgi:hypothetical protein
MDKREPEESSSSPSVKIHISTIQVKITARVFMLNCSKRVSAEAISPFSWMIFLRKMKELPARKPWKK